MIDIEHIWLVPGLPLIGAALFLVAGRWLPRKAVAVLAPLLVLGSFIVSLGIFSRMLGLPPEDRHVTVVLYDWISSGTLNVKAAVLIDPLSLFMILVVSGVAFLIHVYSAGYMADDARYSRYFGYLNLFTFSMLLLVLADNFLVLFMGWELVGLCSYLLIGFWYERSQAANAGRKAFYTTRLGDIGFTIGIVLIFATFGSLDYGRVFGAAGDIPAAMAAIIGLLLLAGAVGKSAQIPLYVWLPDAMEGPTPVSALIHAATMVTAGVYLVARCGAIYACAPQVAYLVAVIGGATALFAATIALANNDIKRILAYSTISQIGYMFMGVGVGAFVAAMFHLMTHAFFKALLFLGAGSVMHGMHGETDIRKMGGLGRKMPVTRSTFLAGSLALAGVVPFAGFWSKDEILWEVFSSEFSGAIWLYAVGLITAALTAFYTFRLYFKVFSGEPRPTEEGLYEQAHESPPVMAVPLFILGVLATVGGFIGLPAAVARPFVGREVNLIHSFLHPVFGQWARVEAASHGRLELALMGIAIVLSLAGIYLAWRWYVSRPGTAAALARRMPRLYGLLANKWYVDEIYELLFIRPGKWCANALYRWVDVLLIDRGAVEGAAGAVAMSGRIIRRLQTGFVRNYALGILGGAIVLVAYLAWRL